MKQAESKTEAEGRSTTSGFCGFIRGGKDPAAPLVGESATGRSAALREGSDRPKKLGKCFVR